MGDSDGGYHDFLRSNLDYLSFYAEAYRKFLYEMGHQIMGNIITSHPLPLTGAKNVRDLGGYPTENGITAKGIFLRADGLHNLTQQDIDFLVEYGVRLVVDLRGSMEIQHYPDPFGTVEQIDYQNVAMLDQMNSSGFSGDMPSSMSELYLSLLENSAADIGCVMALFGSLREGTSIFHCSAGKDRTGVIAMLLLSLAGVSDEIIIADYSATENYMSSIFSAQRVAAAEAGFEIPAFMLRSEAEDMRKTLNYLHNHWGNAEIYLHDMAGCSEELLAYLKAKLRGDMR